jgi:molybdopterin/thiamine biosynthesis adenylyltransferase
MRPAFTGSPSSTSLRGQAVPGAEDRQKLIPGFDQQKFSASTVLFIGAGGINSQIAPTVVRKGIGGVVLVDDDFVEVSNLNRQRFYMKDIELNKALALAENLLPECTAATHILAHPFRFQEAAARDLDLACDVVVCGVDNNPTRVSAAGHFRERGIPVVFTAVSRDGDHGYVFVQEAMGPCIVCLFPDIANDDRYPCPGTPAIADILQAVGAVAVYAIDTLVMDRPREWNYRRITLSDGSLDGSMRIPARADCPLCSEHDERRSA